MATTTRQVPGGQIVTTTYPDGNGDTVQFIPDAGTPLANQRSIQDQAEQAIARMTQVVNVSSFTAAQRDQAIKDQARAIRALLRLALGRFEGAE